MMKLEEYKKREPFKTPEGYFPGLNRKIAEATANAAAKDVAAKRIRIGSFAKWASIAATIAIIFTVALNLPGSGTKENSQPTAEYAQAETEPLEAVDEYSIYEEIIDNYKINDYTFYSYLTEYQ